MDVQQVCPSHNELKATIHELAQKHDRLSELYSELSKELAVMRQVIQTSKETTDIQWKLISEMRDKQSAAAQDAALEKYRTKVIYGIGIFVITILSSTIGSAIGREVLHQFFGGS